MKLFSLNKFALTFFISVITSVCAVALNDSPLFVISYLIFFSTVGHLAGYYGLMKTRRANINHQPIRALAEISAILWIDMARTYLLEASVLGFTVGIMFAMPNEKTVAACISIAFVTCLASMIGCCLGTIIGRKTSNQ